MVEVVSRDCRSNCSTAAICQLCDQCAKCFLYVLKSIPCCVNEGWWDKKRWRSNSYFFVLCNGYDLRRKFARQGETAFKRLCHQFTSLFVCSISLQSNESSFPLFKGCFLFDSFLFSISPNFRSRRLHSCCILLCIVYCLVFVVYVTWPRFHRPMPSSQRQTDRPVTCYCNLYRYNH